jgi:hypothetical protein
MSSRLYSTAVSWVLGRHGHIKLNGKDVRIGGRRIHVPGLPPDVTEIEYVPELGVQEMRVRCDRREEMYPHQVRALDQWLKRVIAWLTKE